ncbi:putative branched-chain amino acid permease (azaleucine resistance) [Saccharomonospora cyanea NA-134]|uniref:Putative branched-chain amino acid permease (Azaleucine resistance) n=1 Tax=Saccharomonospora cyanea NA-134 TaxID=882082 RepID=H5XIY4_9PSEU|nr:putative branched-chain amino acid permease (azaleucine resistance) [Saccharomonospora cyanea NA-134]
MFSIGVVRSIWRTLDRDLARDIALVCLADALVGISFGAITVGSGLPLWLPMLLSVVVFAGAAQFMFVGLVASGGNPVAAVVAALLLNARHVPFGFAVADLLGRRWASRLLGTHLMIDETVAFALAQRERERRRAAYWGCGLGLFVAWNLGVVVGAVVGTAVGDTAALGLDAAFPAVLLALVLPALRDADTRRAVLVGVAVALATAPFVPAGLPVLLGLVGVVAVLRRGATETTDEQEQALADRRGGEGTAG